MIYNEFIPTICRKEEGTAIATVHLYDRRVGVTYVYDSKGYYDRQAHKTKYKRTLIGKLDPETGAVVPTGKRGRPKKPHVSENSETPDRDYQTLYESYVKDNRIKEERIQKLQEEVEQEKKARKECEAVLKRIMTIGKEYQPE